MRQIARALAGVAALTCVCGANAVTLPSGFNESVAIGGLDDPTAVSFSPTGGFSWPRRAGRHHLFDSFADTTPTCSPTCAPRCTTSGPRPLGLGACTRLPHRPYVYVSTPTTRRSAGTRPLGHAGRYSDDCPDRPGDSRRMRRQRPGVPAPGRRRPDAGRSRSPRGLVPAVPEPLGRRPVFGPDGALYVSAGDGASFNFADYGQDDPSTHAATRRAGPRAQTPPTPRAERCAARTCAPGDPVTLDGTVIRVDPDTGRPARQPAGRHATRTLVDRRVRLRNPFRFTFRPGTASSGSATSAGTTGRRSTAWRRHRRAVENFGWPCYEGAAASRLARRRGGPRPLRGPLPRAGVHAAPTPTPTVFRVASRRHLSNPAASRSPASPSTRPRPHPPVRRRAVLRRQLAELGLGRTRRAAARPT